MWECPGLPQVKTRHCNSRASRITMKQILRELAKTSFPNSRKSRLQDCRIETSRILSLTPGGYTQDKCMWVILGRYYSCGKENDCAFLSLKWINVCSLSTFFHGRDKCVRKRSRAEKVTVNREMWSTFQRQKSKIHIAHFSRFENWKSWKSFSQICEFTKFFFTSRLN